MISSEEKASVFNKEKTLHQLAHFLPAQAPLKDFIHHNTLHSFQELDFFDGIFKAKHIFGYQICLDFDEYKQLWMSDKISSEILKQKLKENEISISLEDLFSINYELNFQTKTNRLIGQMYQVWRDVYHLNMSSNVHPLLFRLLCNYLDQGIASHLFPYKECSFWQNIREFESKNFTSIFRSERVRNLFINSDCLLEDLLKILVGKEEYYTQYLFDQQFQHPGWSGIVASIEANPHNIINKRNISLEEIIRLEILMEIDNLDTRIGQFWSPLALQCHFPPTDLFGEYKMNFQEKILAVLQESYEWTYFNDVLFAIKEANNIKLKKSTNLDLQAVFCIDDRCCSIRRNLEKLSPNLETFGTPGFFGLDFYYQQELANYPTKVCPLPLKTDTLVLEKGTGLLGVDFHFHEKTNTWWGNWVASQTLGFVSGLNLIKNLFYPKESKLSVSSFHHIHPNSKITFEHKNQKKNNLKIGFTLQEMIQKVVGVLKSIGMTKDFAGLIYFVGHGASSTNNTHYAGYDCGACSGRPGSVNARVFSEIINKIEVREALKLEGINIPETTFFMGALHDTTRDEIFFYDESLPKELLVLHLKNKQTFADALLLNANERARKFETISKNQSQQKIKKKVFNRSVSLFEPRPELNHANNCLFIVGRRSLTKSIFLDRRAFLNSYDYTQDLEGKILIKILNAGTPVCGGINLEYYFSRMDNANLGAGSKLPHNVMGLLGVANGVDGDLKTGLPLQMIDLHEPLRLMTIIEHYPETVLEQLKSVPQTFEWYKNKWMHLVILHPEEMQFYQLKLDKMYKIEPNEIQWEVWKDFSDKIYTKTENLPINLIIN